jgi:primosomal protein N' (replication factor Y)
LIARVLPDVAGMEGKTFDYVVPDLLRDHVRVGTIVRVALAGRRVQAWVVALDVEPPAGVRLQPIAKVTGWGPSAAVVALAEWAAWRWAGRIVHLLDTASPPGAVPVLPAPGRSTAGDLQADTRVVAALGAGGVTVVRVPPGGDAVAVVAAAVARGDALVLHPTVDGASAVGRALRRAGVDCLLAPRDWPQAAAGGRTALGARAAAWAPVPALAAVVVLDEHDESYQEERAPTWHARDVAVERARRAGVPCVLVSPCPSLEALAVADRVIEPSTSEERAGWPIVEVADRREETPTTAGLYSPALVRRLRDCDAGRAVCVLNRVGRSRLLACGTCGAVTSCEVCGAAVRQLGDAAVLVCTRCGTERPRVCQACGSGALRNLRAGVRRVREELEALVGEPVGEVAAGDSVLPDSRVVVGTEAVLHRVRGPVGTVAFLELDQELLAPRYRAAEQAFALVARAASVLGARAAGGRLLLQTRQPDHVVVQAAQHADPARVRDHEQAQRAPLRFPPYGALAAISGPAAPEYVGALEPVLPDGLELLGPADDRWLLHAPNNTALADALAETPRPAGRLRIEVDPLRV